MHERAAQADTEANAWFAALQKYASPDNSRALCELSVTLLPFIACWVLIWLTLDISVVLTALLACVAAALLVRLFMIQHDCGHGSFFSDRRVNDWLGRALGVLTLTPYDDWKHAHAMHHGSSGNLDHRGVGDITTLTVSEYRSLSRWDRLAYRLYRHPLVMLGIGPTFVFGLRNRFPAKGLTAGWRSWISTSLTNIAILGGVIALASLIGIGPLLRVQIPIWLFAATAGVWLFYVQHQFEHVYWARAKTWNRRAAALFGSSYYALPRPLQWLTANIGVHHVHHLASRIPSYNLGTVIKDHPSLGDHNRITLLGSFRCVSLALIDEDDGKLISFRRYAEKTAAGRNQET